MSKKAPRIAKTARFLQTLVFYDGPQLALFETDRGYKLLAVFIKSYDGGDIFFGCEIDEKSFESYKQGRYDLRYLFKYVRTRHFYILNWREMNNYIVPIRKATDDEINDEAIYPDRGFFEAAHTEEWNDEKIPLSKRSYLIDGKWVASDFSKFCNKLGDIYSFLSITEDLNDENIELEEKNDIVSALTGTSWRGGGSYKGFYIDIGSHAQRIRPLRVSGISYNSPGHIEVEGRSSVFDMINETISTFDENYESIRVLVVTINKILDNENLKSAGKETEFSSESVKNVALELTNRLAKLLKIRGPGNIFKACGNNVIIYAKVILSYFRRIRDLCSFQNEGRVTIN